MYSYTNKKGNTYYLHRRVYAAHKTFVWFFSRNPEGAVELPVFYEVIESPRSQHPVIRKKKFILGGTSGKT